MINLLINSTLHCRTTMSFFKKVRFVIREISYSIRW
jgi:hypothetical protein